MITRDDAREALIRFELDVLPLLIANGFVISVRENWRRKWIDSFASMLSWNRIMFTAEYGTMPMTIEVSRTSDEEYSYTVMVFKHNQTWHSVWSIDIFPHRLVSDHRFRLMDIINPDFEIPF